MYATAYLCRPMHIYDILLKFSWYEKNFRKSSTENQNTLLCSKIFFLEKRVICGIMWKNLVHPNRSQMKTLSGAEKIKLSWRFTEAKIQACTYAIQHILLFHCKNG
jgi:hypothetical protein